MCCLMTKGSGSEPHTKGSGSGRSKYATLILSKQMRGGTVQYLWRGGTESTVQKTPWADTTLNTNCDISLDIVSKQMRGGTVQYLWRGGTESTVQRTPRVDTTL